MDQNRQGARASYVVLAVFIAAWILLPAAVRRFNREAFVEFQAPALHLVAKSRDLATFWEKKSRSTEELAAAGRDLARINAALELKLKAMDDVRRENTRLREVTRYNVPTEYLSVVARVATRDSSSWWQRIVIRKGRNDGIRPGAPVVFGDTVVGRVTAVHLTNKTVMPSSKHSPRVMADLFLLGQWSEPSATMDAMRAFRKHCKQSLLFVVATD